MATQAHGEYNGSQQLTTAATVTPAAELSNGLNPDGKLLSTYLGISFAVFLGLIPTPSISLVPTLQSRNRDLYLRLVDAEEQLRQLRSRRKEDAKANARVVEIFANHRHAWQQEERRLLQQIDAGAEEIAHLQARVEELEKTEAELRESVDELRREVGESDEMLNFMARGTEFEDSPDGGGRGDGGGGCGCDCCSRFHNVRVSERLDPVAECLLEREGLSAEEMGAYYAKNNPFSSEILSSASKFWAEKANLWQDAPFKTLDQQYKTLDQQYKSLDPMQHLKQFVARESPWKVDGECNGVSSKLKLLEQELLNLEKVGKSNMSKVPSQMRKQAKRYQTLAGKIDDLCRRMQASDPCEPTLSTEFRTQRQTEFLFEVCCLQQRANETGKKLTALQTETGKLHFGNEIEGQAKMTTRRCFDSIKNNFKEIQRNLEIWLARINGDLEGILSRDGASRVRGYYCNTNNNTPVSRYPFVH